MNERRQIDRLDLLGLAARGVFLATAVATPAFAGHADSGNNALSASAESSRVDARLPDWQRNFGARQFGAPGDLAQVDTPAIQMAINACSGAHGLITDFPRGNYLSGTFIVSDGVAIYFDAGATPVAKGKLADWKYRPFPRRGGRTTLPPCRQHDQHRSVTEPCATIVDVN